MKKIYLVALAAAVGVSAMAASRQPLAGKLVKNESEMMTRSAAVVKMMNDNQVTKRHKAESAATVADMAGTYTFSFEWLLEAGTAPGVELVLTVDDEATGAVSIAGFPQDFVLKGTVDLAAGTLSIANDQNLGQDSYGDVNYFYLKGADSEGYILEGKSDQEATVGEISGNTITFPALDIWAIGDYNQESLGYWWLSYNNVFEHQVAEDPNKDPNEGWTSLGNAKLQDGWLSPCFGVDQTAEENWYEVELQQNNDNEALYRLVDPYRGNSPVASYNSSTAKHGYIVFDVSDPDHVVFAESEAGFANSELGITKFYPMNSLTFAIGYLKYDKETIISEFADQIDFTTYKDGVVTLASKFGDVVDAQGNVIGQGWINDTCFGIQGQIYGGYGWQDQNGETINMETRIIFPDNSGVKGVEAESTVNAAPEYYNLQGIRISEPVSGSLVICRQGNKVSKILVK